jgi:hypothetical protein
LIIAIIGTCLSFFVIPNALISYLFLNDAGYIITALTFISFIPTSIYLYKKMNLYYTPPKPVYTQNVQGRERICTKCFKVIPFDSQVCPYCGYKYKNYL